MHVCLCKLNSGGAGVAWADSGGLQGLNPACPTTLPPYTLSAPLFTPPSHLSLSKQHLYAPPTRKVLLYEPDEDRVVTRVPGVYSRGGRVVKEG